MVSLNGIKSSIQNILTAISDSFHIEAAVFDSECKLLVCTQKYLIKKGKVVHTPSIEEVLKNGNILVNKPGLMPSCTGCRFKDQCPATIEILNSIKVNNEPIGVISFTSFTSEGQKRLTKNINTYLRILYEVSDLISIFATSRNPENSSHSIVQHIMNMSSDCFLAIDSNGIIEHSNATAAKLLPQCCTHLNSIHHIFPEALVNDILSGYAITNKSIKTELLEASVSSIPILSDDHFLGAVVKINKNYMLNLHNKNTNESASKTSLNNIKGNNEAIKNLKSKVIKVANSSSTILITGETGTGKELFAKAIHYNSERSNFPFITLNCASIPDTLFESELFGYEEGAFTGAKKGGKLGLFELANGGTLFLDEVGEMPFYMQAKLLRVLQDHTISRVGGIRSIEINVRFIAATNKSLEEMIVDKAFRSDLYYRLNVIPLTIPPLRMRSDDIETLMQHFLEKYNHMLKKSVIRFDPSIMVLLKSYDWPGNIRELENLVEYAMNMESENCITQNSLPDNFLNKCILENHDIKDKVKDIELEAIKNALDKYGWDVKGKEKSAKELGIGLRTLYRKIERLKDIK